MGFWTVSIVRDSKRLETTMFRKLDLFPSSSVGGEGTPQLDPLERASLNHWMIGMDSLERASLNHWIIEMSDGSLRKS
jgi:hypothetical protein